MLIIDFRTKIVEFKDWQNSLKKILETALTQW
jgi:hypothetical protein